MDRKIESIVARHADRADEKKFESVEYPGITPEGVDVARFQAKNLLNFLEKAENGTILFLGGVSDQIRTRSTMRVFIDEIKEISQSKKEEDLILIDDNFFNNIKGYSGKINSAVDLINANKDKKIIICFPLYLKEFSLGRNRWLDDKGNLTPYTEKLKADGKIDDINALEEWIRMWTDNKNERRLTPNPMKIAKDHLEGISRLKKFVRQFLPNRPVMDVNVGHSWNLNVLAVYLLNGGRVDTKGLQGLFKKIGKRMVSSGEIVRTEVRDGKSKLVFGDIEIPIEERKE